MLNPITGAGMKNAILQGVLTLAMMLPQGHSADNLKAFAPAEEGMVVRAPTAAEG